MRKNCFEFTLHLASGISRRNEWPLKNKLVDGMNMSLILWMRQWCSGKKRSGHTVNESPQAKKSFGSYFKCSYSGTRVLETWNTKIIPPPPTPGPLLFLIKFGKPSQLHCSGIISRHIRFSIISLYITYIQDPGFTEQQFWTFPWTNGEYARVFSSFKSGYTEKNILRSCYTQDNCVYPGLHPWNEEKPRMILKHKIKSERRRRCSSKLLCMLLLFCCCFVIVFIVVLVTFVVAVTKRLLLGENWCCR